MKIIGKKIRTRIVSLKRLIINSAVIFIDKFSNNPVQYGFLITNPEKDLLIKYLKKSQVYVEFGSGGSTFEALKSGVSKIYSVESSESWTNHMKSWRFIKKNIKTGRLKLIYVNVGKTGTAGYPIDKNSKDLFPNYSSIFNNLDISSQTDTIYIDGRFRCACALNAILNCNSDPIIIIHDFWDRPQHHILLNFLEVIERTGTLGVFKIKKDIDCLSVKKIYEQYKYVFD